jgi:hypothetical protein
MGIHGNDGPGMEENQSVAHFSEGVISKCGIACIYHNTLSTRLKYAPITLLCYYIFCLATHFLHHYPHKHASL